MKPNEEKMFLPPQAEIIDFTNDDIITESNIPNRGVLGWTMDGAEDWQA